MKLALCATGLMRDGAGVAARRDLARIEALSPAELDAVCAALDRVQVPWPKLKGGQP